MKKIIVLCLVFGVGVLGGYFWGARSVLSSGPVRQGGYEFTDPLLVCSVDTKTTEDTKLEKTLAVQIQKEIGAGDITAASIYYRNFQKGNWGTVNSGETFFPASLGKVPLMMAYYSAAETKGEAVLNQKVFYTGAREANAQQEISPKNPIVAGHSYSVGDLIGAMITDSDNNATELLFGNIDQNFLLDAFSDLHVPYLAPNQSPRDFMKVQDYAFFFRVLYNGTYLSHPDSEKALKLLSGTSFNGGLVAGVPAGTPVAHKFGLVSVAPDGTNVTSRELHDCGIVYPHGASPYLLCIMTKSKGSLGQAEQAIAALSKTVWNSVQ